MPHVLAGDLAPAREPRWAIAAVRRLSERVWASGVACLCIAALVFALSVLCVKLTGGRIPVLEITLVRSVLSWGVSVALARAHGLTPIFGHPKHWPLLTLRGVTGTISMALYYASLIMLPMADATVLFFTNPPITAVLAWMIKGERLSWVGASGCLASLAGLVLLVHPPFLFGGHPDFGPQRLWGAGAGVLGAFFAAGAFISIRYLGKAEPALVVALWFHTSTLAISVLPLAVGWPQRAVLPSGADGAALVGVALTSFCGQLMLTRGFQLEPASRASSINFTQVLYSYIFGIIFFSDSLSLMGVTGSVLVAGGVLAVNVAAGPVQATSKSDAARDAAGAGAGSVLDLTALRGPGRGYAPLSGADRGGGADGAGMPHSPSGEGNASPPSGEVGGERAGRADGAGRPLTAPPHEEPGVSGGAAAARRSDEWAAVCPSDGQASPPPSGLPHRQQPPGPLGPGARLQAEQQPPSDGLPPLLEVLTVQRR